MLVCFQCAWGQESDAPQYPSRRGFESRSITSQDYGYNPFAKGAIKLGEKLPKFLLPDGQGQYFDSYGPRDGDLLIVFYRGFW